MSRSENFVLFWKARSIYSNFYSRRFKHQGKEFRWSEQAIMYRKAKLFGADHIAEQIMKAEDPYDCKKLGRSKEIPFIEKVWEKERMSLYKSVLMDKFADPELKHELIQTGDKVLVEASPFDRIWGIGLDEYHPDATNPDKWRGLNLLGKVLMDVREEYKKE